MDINSVLNLQLDTTGQRLFSEICCAYYERPQHALKLVFNTTHGEFTCNAGERISILYLASNTSDKRWAIQYINTIAYGPNPGYTHLKLTELLQERALSVLASINEIAFNKGCANWEEIIMPHHVREAKRVFKNC